MYISYPVLCTNFKLLWRLVCSLNCIGTVMWDTAFVSPPVDLLLWSQPAGSHLFTRSSRAIISQVPQPWIWNGNPHQKVQTLPTASYSDGHAGGGGITSHNAVINIHSIPRRSDWCGIERRAILALQTFSKYQKFDLSHWICFGVTHVSLHTPLFSMVFAVWPLWECSQLTLQLEKLISTIIITSKKLEDLNLFLSAVSCNEQKPEIRGRRAMEPFGTPVCSWWL